MNRTIRVLLPLGAVALGAVGLLAAEEAAPPVSGLQVGEPTPAFDVINVAGPYKGQTLCLR